MLWSVRRPLAMSVVPEARHRVDVRWRGEFDRAAGSHRLCIRRCWEPAAWWRRSA
jgi:hypothetical protein